MKNLLFVFILSCFISNQMNAQQKVQMEVSVNPIAALFSIGAGAVDVVLSPRWGAGADVYFAEGGRLVYLNAKHYFNPREGGDRFHFGTFASIPTQEVNFGIGFFAGHKWLSKDNITFDLAAGLGRQFGDDVFIGILPYFKLNIGYRFKE